MWLVVVVILSVLVFINGHPFLFVENIPKTMKQTDIKEPVTKIKSTVVLPYIIDSQPVITIAWCRPVQQ